MAAEAWVLDGVALTSGAFTLLELTADPPRERADWIAAADSEAAALFRQPMHENRTITMKLRVTAQASMNVALDQVAALVDKLRKASGVTAGIGLVWTPAASTRSVTFSVLTGEITGLPIALGGEGYSWILQRPIVTVEMTCHPYWVGTETLTSTASSSTPFVTLEVANVTGDVPALGRLIVTDTATQSRRHVEWGIEGPLTYNSGTSLIVDSDSMVVSGFSGALSTTTGSYDPNAAGTNSLSATLFANTTVAVCGTGNLSHVGSFRVKARVQFGSNYDSARLAWKALDGPLSTNTWATTQNPGFWEEIDLGTITIPAVSVGTQRWTGQIEATTTRSGGSTFIIDYLTLVPTSDGYGKARATFTTTPGVLVGYDDFTGTTAAAVLNARVATSGGTWATSGDATDLVFADAPTALEETVTRSAISGTAGRIALLGTSTPTDIQVQARVFTANTPTAASTSLDQAVIARYVDASNYLYATLRRSVDSGGVAGRSFEIRQVIATVDTQIAVAAVPVSTFNLWWTIDLTVYATGIAQALLISAAGAEIAAASVTSTVLATAGTLASGKSGILDRNTSTLVFARYYDAFTVYTPAAEPIVIYSGRNMQIRYDDTLRQDSSATYTGRPPSYRGSRFNLPVGTSRVLVKARRSDVEAAADANVTDATQIQVGWTPRGLAVPR